MNIIVFKKQYNEIEPSLRKLEKSVLPIIQSSIEGTGITTLPILHRVKSIESAEKNSGRKVIPSLLKR